MRIRSHSLSIATNKGSDLLDKAVSRRVLEVTADTTTSGSTSDAEEIR